MKDWSISSLKWKWSRSVVSDSLRPHGLTRSSIHGIFQARVLEWAAISFSRGSSWPRDWTGDSHIVGRHITIWATQEVWTISQMSDQNSFPHSSLEWICQLSFTHRGSQEVSPLATNQEYWSGLPFPPPEDLPDPGIEPTSSALKADSLFTEPPGKPKQAFCCCSVAQSCPTLCNPKQA